MTKILLVEDDKSLREIYGVRLLAEGYDIISAGDGEEALAMAIKDRPNLIISDVMMPKISGFDMLDILRSTTETKNIKVIMMTALSSEDQRARGEQLGADRYLVKSQVGIEDVVRTVHEILDDAPTTAVPAQAGFTGAPAPQSFTSPRPETPAIPAREPTSVPAPAPQANSQPPVYEGPAAQTPYTPTPQPVSAPQTPPTAPASGVLPTTPQANESNAQLPQPTAPFSTDRPTGLGLADRVINPLPKKESTGPDINTLLEKELEAPARAPEPSLTSDIQKENKRSAAAPIESSSFAQPSAPAPAETSSPTFSLPTPPTSPISTTDAAPAANESRTDTSSQTPAEPASPAPQNTNPFLAQSPAQQSATTAPTTSAGIDFEETPRQTQPVANPQNTPSNTNPFLQS